MGYSFPVFALDGSAYITTWGPAVTAQTPGLLRLSTKGSVNVLERHVISGEQLSTPAVDAAGVVYLTRFASKATGSDLLTFGPDNQKGWQVHINGTALAPPKVLEVKGGRLIFLSYLGNAPVGGHLMIVNGQGDVLVDQLVCDRIEGGDSSGFHVTPVILGPPRPEDPAVGICTLQSERGKRIFVVVPSNRCGISFYRLDLAANQTATPGLVTIKVVDSDAFVLSAPAISSDGVVVISDSDKRTTAYDVTTGIEKWHFDAEAFVASTPTLLPLGINFVYITSYDRITKLDLATGQFQTKVDLAGAKDCSPAAGGQHLFVSTPSGLFTFDVNLKQLAFAPLAGGNSSPAINPSTGEVCVATTDSRFVVFKGP